MKKSQEGFTLIEIIIAFTILSMGAVLTLNLVTQSSIRVNKVNEYLVVMNTVESAVAILRHEISRQKIKQTYHGAKNNGYEWVARVLGEVNPASAGKKKYFNLYRVQIQVFQDKNKPRLELTTIIANR